jgi:hypothetical protein
MPFPSHQLDFRSVRTLLYLGLLGLIGFVLLRPSIDLSSGSVITASRSVAEDRFLGIMGELGVDMDTLAWMSQRYQRDAFFESLKNDDENRFAVQPDRLNRTGVPLTGWRMQAGPVYSIGAITDNPAVFASGNQPIQLDFDDRMRVRSLRLDASVDAFLAGDSVVAITRRLLTSIMGYDAASYRVDSIPSFETDVGSATGAPPSGTLRWIRTTQAAAGPAYVDMVLRPAMVQTDGGTAVGIEQGLRVVSASAIYHESEERLTETDTSGGEILFYFLTIVILGGIVLVAGFIQIYKGQVILHRAVVVFGLLFFGLLGWRYITFADTYFRLFTSDVILLDLISQGLTYLLLAAFGAISYATWESIARNDDDAQIATVDAIWSGRLWNRQIGRAILSGIAFSGMALALWAAAVFGMDMVFVQWDSPFGHTDIATSSPVTAVLLNAWTNTWLVVFPVFGVVLAVIRKWVRHVFAQMVVGPLVLGLLLVLIGRTSASTGTVLEDILPMVAFSIPLVISTTYFGLLSTLTAWWTAYLLIRLGPYLQAADPGLLMSGLSLASVPMVLLLLGAILHRFAPEGTRHRFVPDYEERNLKQLRIEKEFQIAKESQAALMPTSAPRVPGAEVRGFFIPSFEVGGDYYDHQMHGDELVVTLVDVSGKAMKAAFHAVFTSGLLLSRNATPDPAHVLTDINPILRQRTDRQTFVTCLLVRFDVKTRVLRFANAGNCRPLLKRAGTIRYLDTEAPRFPLGMRSQVEYRTATVPLAEGDLLLFFSDGLPEARQPDGGMLEYAGLDAFIGNLDTDSLSAEAICEAIRQKVLTFSAYDLADDVTVVALKVS